MIQTNKLLPILTGIKKDKKLINESQPQLKLPSKKEIITNKYGQHLFPGKITGIKGGGLNAKGDYVTPLTGEGMLHNVITLNPYGANVLQRGQQTNDQPGNFQLEIPMAQFGGGQEDQISQLIAAYAQLSGLDPQEIIQKLQSLPQDQQQQALQSIAQEVQSAMAQQQQAGPDQQMGMARAGGEPCIDCFDSYNPSPQAQNLEWFYKKAKGGLAKYQGDKGKSQVGKTKLGDFQVGLGKFDADQFRKNVISTQPAATGSGTSVPYDMEEDLRMQELAAQKMAAYQNNDRSFDSTYMANQIPLIMKAMVDGQPHHTSIKYQDWTTHPANYFSRNLEGLDFTDPMSQSYLNQYTESKGPYWIDGQYDQGNRYDAREAAYNAWQKGDKLTKSYLSNDQINELAQRMALGQNFSDISYEEMLSAPDLKKVQEAAAKLAKKAKGGTAYMMDDLYRNGGLKKFAPGGPDKPVGGKGSFYQSQDQYDDGSANESSSASASPSLASYDYNYGNYANPYEAATPNFIPSGMNQDMYTITPADYQAQLVQTMGTRQALESALQRSAQSAKAATQPSTSPVVKPEQKSTPVDDSKMVMQPSPKTTHSFVYDVAGSSVTNPTDELLRQQALKASIGYKLGLPNNLNIGLTGNYNVNKDVSTASDVSPITNQGFTTGVNVSKKWGDRGGLQGGLDWDTRTGNLTGKVTGSYTIGAGNKAMGGEPYQDGRQTGKKTPNYEPNWFARRTSVPGQALGALANFLPWFGSSMLSTGNDIFNSYEGDQYYAPNTTIPYGDLSQYMINRRYANMKPIPEYDEIIQKLTPEQLEQLSGPMFKGGGEAFPQAQTYLPYMRRGETRPNFMFKNGGQKKASSEEYQKRLLIDLLNNQ